MNKLEFKQSQPVAFELLSRTLRDGSVSHAYLFTGPKGAPVRQSAMLFAKSMHCEHPDENGFACQECPSCKSFNSEENLDFYHLHKNGIRQKEKLSRKEMDEYWDTGSITVKADKTPWRIKKENIIGLQESFALSSATGKRQIALLEDFDLATPDASNALLKFLEEPHENLTLILCAGQSTAVLPTILSRTQIITLSPVSPETLQKQLMELLHDEESAAMFARNGTSLEEIEDMDREVLDKLKQTAKTLYESSWSMQSFFELEKLIADKSAITKSTSRILLQWLLYLCSKDTENALHSIEQIRILLDSMDRTRSNTSPALLLERCIRQLQKSVR